MFLGYFLTISLFVSGLLVVYERRAIHTRRFFLQRTSPERFHDLTSLSLNSVTGLLSFSSVIFSIWAGFGLLAPLEVREVFSEDILVLLTTCALSMLCYAICFPVYHLAHYAKLEKNEKNKELRIKAELFIRGETFFMFGTAFFLLTFLFSFIIMFHILYPSITCFWAIICLIAAVIAILAILTFRDLKKIILDVLSLKEVKD